MFTRSKVLLAGRITLSAVALAVVAFYLAWRDAEPASLRVPDAVQEPIASHEVKEPSSESNELPLGRFTATYSAVDDVWTIEQALGVTPPQPAPKIEYVDGVPVRQSTPIESPLEPPLYDFSYNPELRAWGLRVDQDGNLKQVASDGERTVGWAALRQAQGFHR